MIQAVCESCSVRWTKVNRKVYKFQSLVFNEESENSDSEASSTSESKCQGHSKITAPTHWKEVYGDYLGEGHEITKPKPDLHVLPQTDSKSIKTATKKDDRRVHFEEGLKDSNEQQEKHKSFQGCLPDCYLCRSYNTRKTSPPYQVMPEKMETKDDESS